jgi:hypothetical protein
MERFAVRAGEIAEQIHPQRCGRVPHAFTLRPSGQAGKHHGERESKHFHSFMLHQAPLIPAFRISFLHAACQLNYRP